MEVHQVRAHLLVAGIDVGVSCSGGATRAGGSAAEKNGKGVLVEDRRREEASELRGSEAE